MMISTMMQTTNVGLTGMMNDGRHHQPQIQHCSSFKTQHCCCFAGSSNGDYQYQDQHRGCHGNPNLAYYQQQQPYVQQNTTWYNNNEYEHYNIYQDQGQTWPNTQSENNSSSSTSSTWTSSTSPQQLTNPSKSPNYEQYYSSYPTPPTPAGSVASTGSAGECPPSVAPSLQSIPSDHYPPTPYSVDLSSPTSSSDHQSAAAAAAAASMGYATNMGYSSPNSTNSRGSAAIDIPLHELIGAAEAVEADLLESMQVVQAENEKAVAASNKPKNMASSTCSTSSSINSSCWKESLEQQQQPQVAETAAAPPATTPAIAAANVAVTSGSATFHAAEACNAALSGINEVNFVRSNGHQAKRYDPEQLQRFLSDACSDWQDRPRRLKRTRSPSPPRLDAHSYDSGEENISQEIGPPRLEMQAKKVKTIRLTKFADEKHVSGKSSRITKNFTFACSSCSQSWPLHSDYIDNISQHLSQSGTAPLLKSNRLAFSQFFQYFSFKVRLLVNPKMTSVSTKTVLVCNQDCQATFNLEQEQEDLPLLLHQHLRDVHQVSLNRNYCYFCDRKVHNLTRHLDEYFSIHHSRLMALATCHHTTPSAISEAAEAECKKCKDIYVPDPRLPDWMSRATCSQCLKFSLENQSKPSTVILCQYCRQGKFGLTTSCQSMSISICLNCSKMAQAFHKMTDASQCRTYVTGMLNELLKQLGQESPKVDNDEIGGGEKLPEATFSLRQLLQTSVLDDKVKLAKFQSFTLHNMKTIEAVNAASANTIKDAPKTKISCSKCRQETDWDHLVQQSGTLAKHLSKSLDQNLVIYSTADSSKVSLTSVLRCRKCKFYLPTHSDKQLQKVLEHVQSCQHPPNSSNCCAVCGAAGNSKHDCGQTLKESLVLHCHQDWAVNNNNQNKAVNNLRKNVVNIGKLAKCLNIISHAFLQESNDCSIEELIVASKQKIKS